MAYEIDLGRGFWGMTAGSSKIDRVLAIKAFKPLSDHPCLKKIKSKNTKNSKRHRYYIEDPMNQQSTIADFILKHRPAPYSDTGSMPMSGAMNRECEGSQHQVMKSHRILIVGGRTWSGLCLARVLGAQGYWICTADDWHWDLIQWSRFGRKKYLLPSPAGQADKYYRVLKTIIDKEGITAVFATSIHGRYLTKYREPLANRAQVYTCSWQASESLGDCGAFVSLSESLGLPVAPTATVRTPDQYRAAHQKMVEAGFQALLKPSRCESLSERVYRRALKTLPKAGLTDREFCAAAKGRDMVLQAKLTGTSIKARVCAFQGEVICREDLPEDCCKWVRTFCQKTKCSGWLTIGFIRTLSGEVKAYDVHFGLTCQHIPLLRLGQKSGYVGLGFDPMPNLARPLLWAEGLVRSFLKGLRSIKRLLSRRHPDHESGRLMQLL